MRRIRSIWLVARREILERGRSRGYVLSLAFTIFLLGAGFVLPTILAGERGALQVGIVEPTPAGLETALRTAAAATAPDAEIEFTTYPDRAAAESAVEEGTIVAAFDVPPDLRGPGEVVVRESATTIVTIMSQAVPQLRAAALLEEAGVDRGALAAAAEPPAVSPLEEPAETDSARFLIANAGVILMFIGIFSYGFWVLGGVVEEKQSRVVEVVLSTVRPRDLLIGKVLGIGLLGMVQLVIIVVFALGAATVTGRFELPDTTPSAIGQLAFWFVLGFLLYATALGFLGALASRQEEAQTAAMPVTMVATGSYLVALLVVTSDPSGLVAQIATFVPVSAPMVVPLRAALDAIEPWEIGVSIAITLVTIWALFTIGGRIYSGAILSIGGRVKLRDAWRASQD
jgi:ABC-2 type transport system permease protein